MSRRATSFALLVALALAVGLLVPRLHGPAGFDAIHVYLPMARGVLDQGLAFMERPESLVTAPIAYLYPALLGASEVVVRHANVAVFCATILLAFMTLAAAHSREAGIAAAFALAIAPTLRPYIADALTEPPYLFLVAAWIACVALVSRGRSMKWAIAGGVALGLAALTRPAAMYFAPLMIAVFAFTRLAPKPARGRLVAMHAVGLAIVALWILRNAVVFGFPAVATGAGAALYFGVNPLVDGFEPAYYGMNYDSGVAQDDVTHLSIHADRRLRAIALTELADTPPAVIAEMSARKAIAFLFVSSAESSGEPLAWLRAWRIAVIVLASAAVILRRKSVVVAVLAMLVAYMVAVHLPVFYNHRYSVGAIDFPLALLAAVGLAEAAKSARVAAVASVALAFALGLGLPDITRAGPSSPKPERIPHEVMWLADVHSSFAVGPGQPPIDIPITKDAHAPPWDLSMLQVDLALTGLAKGASCDAMTVRFRPASAQRFEEGRSVRIFLPASLERSRRITLGSTIPLALEGAGTVRLELQCASPATAEIGTMAVIAPRREIHYRDRFLERERRP